MFSSSSLSSLSTLSLEDTFSPRHISMMLTIDALWSLETVEGGKASAAYIGSLSELESRKFRNAMKAEIDATNNAAHRSSMISLFMAFVRNNNKGA